MIDALQLAAAEVAPVVLRCFWPNLYSASSYTLGYSTRSTAKLKPFRRVRWGGESQHTTEE